jgi:signal transduction histidine kinase
VLQILFNLVDNALKYARAATRREIVIHCQREDDGVLLVVRDYGPGVPAAMRERLFEPFFRGDPSQIQATGGAGIGLALVKDLAQAMQAHVETESPADGGFLVSLRFPGSADSA